MKADVSIDQLQGFWLREWIEVDGVRKDDTYVVWAQAGTDFVDIRIPNDRIDAENESSLASASASAFDNLFSVEGFAGHIELENDLCTWKRELNWQGFPTETDAGYLAFEHDCLIETGAHAPYAEKWCKLSDAIPTARRLHYDNLTAILIVASDSFLFGVGSPCSRESIYQSRDSRINHLKQSEYSFGQWDGGLGVIKKSTNPLQENKDHLHAMGDKLRWRRENEDGSVIDIELSPQA